MGQKFIIPYTDGSIYEGDCDPQTAKPHGKGVIKFKNGSTFQGVFENGYPTIGKIIFKQKDITVATYEGTFKDRTYHGLGTLSYPTGETQKGNFQYGRLATGFTIYKNGSKHDGAIDNAYLLQGNGVYTNQYGDLFEGSFEKGQLFGNTKIMFKNKDFYQGKFAFGQPNGQGIFVQFEGFRYEGNFSEGRIQGKGKLEYKNGDYYFGDFLNNKKHGYGIYSYKNGTIYTGNFAQDEFSGWCRIEFSSTSNSPFQMYTGEVVNGLFQGIGQLIYRNGDIYEGEFYQNNKCGRGKLVFKEGGYFEGAFNNLSLYQGIGILEYYNGDIYEGQFRNGVKQGWGTYKYKQSGISFEGEWKNNLKHGQGTVTNGRAVQTGFWFEGNKQKQIENPSLVKNNNRVLREMAY